MVHVGISVASGGRRRVLLVEPGTNARRDDSTHDDLKDGYRITFVRPWTITVLDDEPFVDEDFGDEAMTRDIYAFAERTSRLKLDVDMDMLLIGGAGI